ncbi:MAG TPA: phytanoyl-CoA dioxygenase family protein [Stellaceae bacterium]|nr:phytanoyl-CoA dioxygenase family protein [Stellaceae bacterium]
MAEPMLRSLLTPFWLARVLTQEKSFERNPVIANRWLNERGLHGARVAAAHRLTQARRNRLATRLRPEDRTALDRDGFIVKRDFLPPQLFADLVAQVRGLRTSAREMVEGDTITRRIALEPSILDRLPAVRRLLRMPDYRNLIRYAGSSAAAPMVYLQTILTGSIAGEKDPQTAIHADTFHPTVKAWLYLNDAASEAAPLIYVPGSHRLTPRRLEWERRMALSAPDSPDADTRQGSFRVDPDELTALGLPAPRILNEPANTLIVADTFGFHARGRSPEPSTRVEIWAYGRRNPFLPWLGLDPWSIPAFGLRRPVIHWRLLDLAERAGLGRHRWRPSGEISAFDPPVAPPAPLRAAS